MIQAPIYFKISLAKPNHICDKEKADLDSMINFTYTGTAQSPSHMYLIVACLLPTVTGIRVGLNLLFLYQGNCAKLDPLSSHSTKFYLQMLQSADQHKLY